MAIVDLSQTSVESVEKALAMVRGARDKDDKVLDILIETRGAFDRDSDEGQEFLKSLFEASREDVTDRFSSETKELFFNSVVGSGPLLSSFNEYYTYLELAHRVMESENTNFARPSNSMATAIAESSNPVGSLFATLRAHKKLSDLQFATILEATFPLATNGLDEETRDYLFNLANERGLDQMEVANVYSDLIELVIAARFLNDED